MAFYTGLVSFTPSLINAQKIEPSVEINSIPFIKNKYILGPGDVLKLDVFSASEFSGNYTILRDGTVPLPLIGILNLEYLTLFEATQLIEKEYKNELIEPQINLTLARTRPLKVSVVGEIERPGVYSFITDEIAPVENPIIYPSLTDAIQKAGGITQNANLKKVKISRRMPGYKPQYKEAYVDLLDLVFKGEISQNPYLFDGDIISIAKVNKVSPETLKIANANLSPKEIKVSVIGKVANPGNIIVSANTTLNQAVLIAGGPIDWVANSGNIELVRINNDGSAIRKKYKINLSEGISEERNPPLMNKDIIKVNSSSINKIGTGISTLTSPLAGLITAFTFLKLIDD